MVQKLLWLSLAGACGTVSRYVLSELASRVRGYHLPLGTLAVNVLGSFLFGLIYVLARKKLPVSSETHAVLLVGFMGAFTTFSTFAFETARMLKSAQWGLALGNVLAQVLLGLAALVAGVLVARMI